MTLAACSSGKSTDAPHDGYTSSAQWSDFASHCKESPASLDREVAYASGDLSKHGDSESDSDLVSQLDTSVGGIATGRVDCSGVIGALLLLAESPSP